MNQIDFVIAWVDGNDEKWKAEKKQILNPQHEERFRDWDFLRFLFRGIEQYAPWVHHIYLVTDAQCPAWLNTAHDKVTVVDHRDFIPGEYLPTFNSHTIELNIHRIPGLSDQFVYFNDDLLIMNSCKPEDFFRDGIPVDEAVLNGINGTDEQFAQIQFHNISLLNRYYSHKAVLQNISKWLYPFYGFRMVRTLLLLPFKRLQGIYNPHGPLPLLKSTCNLLWERDGGVLDETCRCRERSGDNVSAYVFRYEQLLSGNFVPSKSHNRYLEVAQPVSVIAKAAVHAKTVCINDVSMSDKAFIQKKKSVCRYLQHKFPKKSGFEK